MACLLNLPVELRAEIIDDVILAQTPAPQDVAALRQRSPQKWRSDIAIDGNYTRATRFEETHDLVVPNSLGLLLCNKQLHVETQAAVTRLQAANPFQFHLDLMVVGDGELLPTWIFAPATMSFFSRVLITIRLFDADSNSAPNTQNIQLGRIYDILERFLLVVSGHGAVGVLELEFLNDGTAIDAGNPTSQLVQWSFLQGRFGDTQGAPIDVLVPRSNWIANSLAESMGSSLKKHHASRFGALMFERVGTLRVCAEPWVERHFSLGDMLAELRFGDPNSLLNTPDSSKIARGHWAWKEAALKTRRDTGLPIGSLVIQRPPSPVVRSDTTDDLNIAVQNAPAPTAISSPRSRNFIKRLRAGFASVVQRAGTHDTHEVQTK